jgi:hypothetical protein
VVYSNKFQGNAKPFSDEIMLIYKGTFTEGSNKKVVIRTGVSADPI